MNRARNALARIAVQIRTGHWRSAVFLKRIKKRRDDKCWFYHGPRMSRSHVLLHCSNAKLRAAREEACEGRVPGGIRVLLNNPRWEQRLPRFWSHGAWAGWWRTGPTWKKLGPRGWTGGLCGRQRRGLRSRRATWHLFPFLLITLLRGRVLRTAH